MILEMNLKSNMANFIIKVWIEMDIFIIEMVVCPRTGGFLLITFASFACLA